MALRWLTDLFRRPPDDTAARALFDAAFYRASYPEANRQRDPFAYFMRKGWRLGHKPHPVFDTRWYLANNEDVRRAVAAVSRSHGHCQTPPPETYGESYDSCRCKYTWKGQSTASFVWASSP